MKDCNPPVVVTRHEVQSTPLPWPSGVQAPLIGQEWRVVCIPLFDDLGVDSPFPRQSWWGYGNVWMAFPAGIGVATIKTTEYASLAIERLTPEQVLLAERALSWKTRGGPLTAVDEHRSRHSGVATCPTCERRWFVPHINKNFRDSHCDKQTCGPWDQRPKHDEAWMAAIHGW